RFRPMRAARPDRDEQQLPISASDGKTPPNNTRVSQPAQWRGKAAGGNKPNQKTPPRIFSPIAGLDVPWLLAMRAQSRRDPPFLIWAPFDAPSRAWTYGEFHERVGALAAGLLKRGVKQGEFVLIHLDNCIEALLAWFACVELGAIAVTT